MGLGPRKKNRAKGSKKGKGSAWQQRVGRIFREKEPEKIKRKREEEENEESESEKPEEVPEKVEEAIDDASKRRKVLYETENKDNQLFVRNLPADATVDEITERFSKFGKVFRVLQVKDRQTGRPTGVAFIHFNSGSAVTKVMAESETQGKLSAMEGLSKKLTKPQTRKQQKTLAFKGNNLGGEQSECGILFNGRVLSVNPALQRRDAAKLTRASEKEQQKEEQSDPRNLALLEEGRVTPNTPAAADLTQKRLDLLGQRYMMKKRKLRDPNYFVSPTRLCFRDLPDSFEETNLKKMIMKSIRGFTAENPDFDFKAPGYKKNPFMKQCQVVKDANGQSRGFAFIEFRDKKCAVHVLRDLNNNPNLFPSSNRRLDVEFAVESVHILNKLKMITEKGKEKNKFFLEKARAGEDAKEEWRKMKIEQEASKEAEKTRRKKEFEKWKNAEKFAARREAAAAGMHKKKPAN